MSLGTRANVEQRSPGDRRKPYVRDRTILFHGALRSENFGDVLLAQVNLSWIREVTQARILATESADEVTRLLGLDRATLTDRLLADAFILSGGAFFNFPSERAPGSEIVRFFARNSWPLLSAQLLGKPTAIIGVGAHGARHPLWRAVARAGFARAKTASVRDAGSWKATREFGVRRMPDCTADSVFYLDVGDLSGADLEFGETVVSQSRSGRRIGIHLSGSPANSPAYERLFEAICARSVEHPEVTIFAIEDHPSSIGGQRAAQHYLLQRLGPETCVPVQYPGANRLTAVLASLDAVLSDKLHVGLVAAAMGTPPFTVSKHPKNAPAYDELGLSDHCVMLDAACAADIARLTAALFTTRDRFTVPERVRLGAKRNRELVHAFITEYLN